MNRPLELRPQRPTGKHRCNKGGRFGKRFAWLGGAVIVGISAALVLALAITDVVPSSGSRTTTAAGPSKTQTSVATTMTRTQARQLASILSTPRGRAEVQRALNSSFGRTGAKINVGPPPAKAVRPKTTLTAYDWQAGVTGNHIWIIASYAEIYGWSLLALTAKCAKSFPDAAVGCAVIGGLLGSLDIGHGNSPSHGVWIAGYFFSYGSFAVSAFYKWTWGRY
jgi:hypothetical protein